MSLAFMIIGIIGWCQNPGNGLFLAVAIMGGVSFGFNFCWSAVKILALSDND